MKIDTNRLIKVSTYAKKVGMSTMWIGALIKRKDLKGIKIDGVQFIVMEDEK